MHRKKPNWGSINTGQILYHKYRYIISQYCENVSRVLIGKKLVKQKMRKIQLVLKKWYIYANLDGEQTANLKGVCHEIFDLQFFS